MKAGRTLACAREVVSFSPREKEPLARGASQLGHPFPWEHESLTPVATSVSLALTRGRLGWKLSSRSWGNRASTKKVTINPTMWSILQGLDNGAWAWPAMALKNRGTLEAGETPTNGRGACVCATHSALTMPVDNRVHLR